MAVGSLRCGERPLWASKCLGTPIVEPLLLGLLRGNRRRGDPRASGQRAIVARHYDRIPGPLIESWGNSLSKKGDAFQAYTIPDGQGVNAERDDDGEMARGLIGDLLEDLVSEWS
jgi:hypothetical protein